MAISLSCRLRRKEGLAKATREHGEFAVGGSMTQLMTSRRAPATSMWLLRAAVEIVIGNDPGTHNARVVGACVKLKTARLP